MGDQTYDEDLPREHVIRPSVPWRDEPLTECGREPGQYAIDREAFILKVKKQGPKRAAMTTCMTCFETAQRWPDWDANPVAVVAREVGKVTHWYGGGERHPLHDELLAITLLIEAHREEFDEILTGLRSTLSLAAHRRSKRAAAIRKRGL